MSDVISANVVEVLGQGEASRVFLPPGTSEAVRPPRAEAQAARPQVAAVAEAYFSSADRLHGDTMPSVTIARETPFHRLMIYAHASGKSVQEIALQTGYSAAQVSAVLRQPWARQRLLQLLKETNMDAIQHFHDTEVMPSLEVLREIRDDAQEKASSRIVAANSILDRALGKPLQQVKTDNTNRNVPDDMARLDAELDALRKQVHEVDPQS